MKNIITVLCVSIIALFADVRLSAQSYTGLNTSNHAGVIGATIHPASIEDYPKKFDMVFLGIDAFGDNNYERVSRDRAFLNFNFSNLTRSPFRNRKTKYAMLRAEVTLPSFMVKTKKWGTIGFIPRIRTYANADNVSADFSTAIADGFENAKLFDKKFLNQHLDLTAMSWGEIGITWAKVLKINKNKRLTLGVTPKILIGNAAAFVNFRSDTLTNVGSGAIKISDFRLAYGSSDNLNGIADKSYNYEWKKGNKLNFGLDIGVEYTYYKNNYHPAFSKYMKLRRANNNGKNNYKYKLSFSLLDIGRIRYSHGEYSTESTAALPSVSSLDVTLLNGTFGNPTALRDALSKMLVTKTLTGSYTVGLPTTLQMGIDYHLKGNAYINGNLAMSMNSFKWSDHAVSDITHITITPRWENHWFGLHTPVYANVKGSANLGLGVRAGPLVFGISDMLPFVSKKEVSSEGVYIVFKTFIGNKKEKSNVECATEGWRSVRKRKK